MYCKSYLRSERLTYGIQGNLKSTLWMLIFPLSCVYHILGSLSLYFIVSIVCLSLLKSRRTTHHVKTRGHWEGSKEMCVLQRPHADLLWRGKASWPAHQYERVASYVWTPLCSGESRMRSDGPNPVTWVLKSGETVPDLAKWKGQLKKEWAQLAIADFRTEGGDHVSRNVCGL